jgi:hypothetical protein
VASSAETAQIVFAIGSTPCLCNDVVYRVCHLILANHTDWIAQQYASS